MRNPLFWHIPPIIGLVFAGIAVAGIVIALLVGNLGPETPRWAFYLIPLACVAFFVALPYLLRGAGQRRGH